MILPKVLNLLKDQELFRTISIDGAKYTVIYRNNGYTLIIKSEGCDEELTNYCHNTLDINQLPKITCEMCYGIMDAAATFLQVCRERPNTKYLAFKAAEYYGAPASPLLYLGVPEDCSDVNVERTILALFVEHLQCCEDRLMSYHNLVQFKQR